MPERLECEILQKERYIDLPLRWLLWTRQSGAAAEDRAIETETATTGRRVETTAGVARRVHAASRPCCVV